MRNFVSCIWFSGLSRFGLLSFALPQEVKIIKSADKSITINIYVSLFWLMVTVELKTDSFEPAGVVVFADKAVVLFVFVGKFVISDAGTACSDLFAVAFSFAVSNLSRSFFVASFFCRVCDCE